jgi:hypothetical protein
VYAINNTVRVQNVTAKIKISQVTRQSELKLKILAAEGLIQLTNKINQGNLRITLTKNRQDVTYEIASTDSEKGKLTLNLNFS